MPSSDAKVKLFYGNAWNDITADTFGRDDIHIVAGQQDEASAADPASCSVTLNNGTSKVNASITGRYTPRNPLSDLYGKISRNDKFRVEVAATGREGLWLPGATGSDASTPDAASLDITGDIDVRVDLTKTWHPEFNETLLQKYDFSGDQRSWRLRLISTGGLQFEWSTDGTSSGAILGAVSDVLPDDGERRAVRATLDVDDGAGNRVLRYYTAPTIDGPWTQLGSASTVAGTTSIFSSSASLEVGVFEGTAHAAEVRSGIDGTVVSSPDFATGDPDDRTITDGQNLTWTINGQARIVRPDIRFCGGVASWPPRWDVGGFDLWVPVEAAGVLRRMGQGQSVVRSSLYRDLSTKTNLVAYWACEEGENAQSIAETFGGQSLSVAGDVTLASESGIDGSDALPAFGTGTFSGPIPFYSTPPDQRILCLLSVPDTVPGTSRSVLQLRSSGDVKEWRLRIRSDGAISIHGWDANNTEVINSIHSTVNLLGKVAVVWLWLEDSGPDTNWQIGAVQPGEALPVSVTSGTRTSNQTGRFTSIIVGSGADLGGTAIGHVALMNSDVHGEFWDTIDSSLIAWSGEQAHSRFSRLAEEESITGIVRGSDSEQMGAQTISTLLDLWQQCADTDLGLLNEYGCDGFLFRAHKTLQNQIPALTLDYDQGHLAPPLEPVDDDQQLRNDITVSRAGGSEYHATLDTGPLSIADAGRYDVVTELSLHHDSQLESQAWWRLSLGTWNAARYPSVTVDLLRNPALRAEVLSIEPGDLIRLTNLPNWLPPDDADLIVLGRDETIGSDGRHLITFNCMPGEPWKTWVLGDGKRLQAVGSQLMSAVTSTATAVDVATTSGAGWITTATHPAMFPFDVIVGGERWTVSDITGSSVTYNEGFETGIVGWSASAGISSISQSSERARTDLRSMKAVPTSWTHTTVYVQTDFATAQATIAGALHTASAWVYTDGSLVGPNGIRVLLLWFDSGGTVIGTTAGVQTNLTGGSWEEFTASGVAPTSTARVGIRVEANEDGGMDPSDTFYVDDVAVTSKQTFTVTRSVNGVVKSHDEGAAVKVADPARPGL